MPHRKWLLLAITALAAALPLSGALLGTRLYRPAEDSVLAEIKTQQHALDQAVRGALDTQLERVSTLLAAAANLPSIRDTYEEAVGERLALLGPLVPQWTDLLCVDHGTGELPHCVTREAGILKAKDELLLQGAHPTPKLSVLFGRNGRTTILQRHALDSSAGTADLRGGLFAVGQLSSLLQATLQAVRLTGEMELEVYRDDGTILYHPNPSYLDKTWEEIEASERPLNSWTTEEEGEEEAARESFLSKESGWVRYVNQNAGGQTLLARYGPLPSIPGLHLVLSRRLDEVKTALREQRSWAAGVGALAAVPVVLMLLCLYQRRRAEYLTLEETAGQTEVELQTVLDAVGAWVFTTNRDRTITRANHCMREDLFAMGEIDPVGRGCHEVFGGAMCSDCPAARGTGTSDARYFEAGLQDRLLLITVRPIPTTDGAVETLHTAEDITESRQVRNALAEAERHSSAVLLAGSIGHEINNVVTSLAAYADMLTGRAEDPAFCRKTGEIFSGQLARIALLASNLLSSSKFPKPDKSTTDVVALFQATLERLHTAGILRPFEVQTEWQTLPPVVCDPGQIDQALTNLLVNAGQAMGNVGVLHLSTCRLNGTAVLTVQDTGPGLDPDQAKHIFEPFFTTKGEKGTGLGLYVTRQIVEAHGGRVELDSSPGRGTRFSLVLPLD